MEANVNSPFFLLYTYAYISNPSVHVSSHSLPRLRTFSFVLGLRFPNDCSVFEYVRVLFLFIYIVECMCMLVCERNFTFVYWV